MADTELLDRQLSIDTLRDGRESCSESGIGCVEYHYLRPILRRLGAVASPYTHARFYEDALSDHLGEAERPSVIVSGTADYTWLLPDSPLVAAARSKAGEMGVIVSDACPTPLRYSLIAAGRSMIQASQLQADLRSGLTPTEQDAIVTDAFLTQFPDANDRIAVLRQWYRCMRIGGIAVTTVQIRPDANSSQSRGASFTDNVGRLYESSEYPAALGMDPEDFKQLVARHTTGKTSRVYASEDELLAEIAAAGLSVLDMQPMVWHSPTLDVDFSYREVILKRAGNKP